ncbi:MAG: glucose-1-phosphate cytidylyltransferase [Acidimicrobiales bacterium]
MRAFGRDPVASSAKRAAASLPVVVLCGGMGTRLMEETSVIPKPLVSIGGRPLLWHLMRSYGAFGCERFVLCLGYRGEAIKRFVLDYRLMQRSFTLEVGSGHVELVDGGADSPAGPASGFPGENWTVSCVDTGLSAMTGARLARVRRFVDGSRFFLTYGDGLSDVDLDGLLAFHEAQGAIVTLTAVAPTPRFGDLEIDGPWVGRFAEKERQGGTWVNGGFFVCEPEVFDYLDDDDSCVLEREPLERLAKEGRLAAYRHDGFWQCMDTMHDREQLEEIWASGAPWAERWDET